MKPQSLLQFKLLILKTVNTLTSSIKQIRVSDFILVALIHAKRVLKESQTAVRVVSLCLWLVEMVFLCFNSANVLKNVQQAATMTKRRKSVKLATILVLLAMDRHLHSAQVVVLMKNCTCIKAFVLKNALQVTSATQIWICASGVLMVAKLAQICQIHAILATLMASNPFYTKNNV